MYDRPFRWWVQSVMPLVFDDSLSYYEVLAKLTKYIEGLTGDVDQIEKILATIEGIEDVTQFTEMLESIKNEIGNLTNLSTQSKTDLVSAINEVALKADIAYYKPPTGIPESDLSQEVQDKLNKTETASEYIVNNVKLKPSPSNNTPADLGLGTYSVPRGGIPWDTLSQDVQDRINAGGGGTGGTTDYTDLNNKPQINGHTLNAGDNTAESLGLGTYSKPNSGIPESDLSAEVQEKLNTSGGIADNQESFVASRDYEAGELVYINGVLYKTKYKILTGTTMVPGNNIETTDISAELEKINSDIEALQSGSGPDSWSLNANVVATNTTPALFLQYFNCIGGESYLFITRPTDTTPETGFPAYAVEVLKRDGTVVATFESGANQTVEKRYTFTPVDTGEYYCRLVRRATSGNTSAKVTVTIEYTQSQGISELWAQVNQASQLEPRVVAVEALVEQQQEALSTLENVPTDIVALQTAKDDLYNQLSGGEKYLANTNKAPIYALKEISGTQRTLIYDIDIPTGTYDVYIENVTSSDTDSDTSAIYFYYEDGVSVKLNCDRNTPVKSSITFERKVNHIGFFAGFNNAQSAGDTFSFTGFGVGKAITDTTLEVTGVPADSKTVGDKFIKEKDDLNYFLNNSCLPVALYNEIAGTGRTTIEVTIPASDYLVKVDSIESADTDSTVSSVYFYFTEGGYTRLVFGRNKPCAFEITFSKEVNTIVFFASSSANPSTGDSFTYYNFSIGKKIDRNYKIIEGDIAKGTFINGVFTTTASRVGSKTIQKFDSPSILIPTENYNLRVAFFDSELTWMYDINGIKGNMYIPAGSNIGVSIYQDGSPSIDDSTNLVKLLNDNLKILSIDGYEKALSISKQSQFSCMGIFPKIGVCGDSFASGSIYSPDGTWHGDYNLSWPQIMARENGVTAVNFSKGGLSTKTWLSDSTWGLTKLLDTEAQNLYILAFGINDYTQIYSNQSFSLGSVSDLMEDYSQNPETFYGCYGKIIGNIKTHAPNAKIVMLSVARYNERKNMDEAIREIAEYFGLPFIYLPDDYYFISPDFYHGLVSNHPTPIGYGSMARAISNLIISNMSKNINYWLSYSGL